MDEHQELHRAHGHKIEELKTVEFVLALTGNSDRIKARWPKIHEKIYQQEIVFTALGQTIIVGGHQLTSAIDRKAEALMQAAHIADGEEVWLYGVGLGELPRLMLARGREVHMVLLNLAMARAAFDYVDMPWLDDPNIELHLAGDLTDAFVPYSVSTPELRSAPVSPLRDRLMVLLNQPYNDFTLTVRDPLCKMHQEMNKRFTDPSVRELYGNKLARAIVCMGGPTLGDYYDWIKNDCAPVIAASTVLKPLLAAGITPSYTMVIDALPSMMKHFRDIEIAPSMALVYHDIVFPAIVDLWTGPRYKANISTNPDSDLLSGGSVLHTAIDLAVRMGAKEVVLLGADLCYRDQSHVAGAASPHTTNDAWRIKSTNARGEEVKTDDCLMQYHWSLERYIYDHPEVKWFRGGRDGMAVEGITWID